MLNVINNSRRDHPLAQPLLTFVEDHIEGVGGFALTYMNNNKKSKNLISEEKIHISLDSSKL